MGKISVPKETEEYLASKFRDDFDKLCQDNPMVGNLCKICRERGFDRYQTILYLLQTFEEFHKLVKASTNIKL